MKDLVAMEPHPCAMGSRVFIWGGATDTTELATGAIYDPMTDTWIAVAGGANAPSARVGASCVWTGTVVVVFGGGDLASTADVNTGGRYDPATLTWSATSTTGAPSARRYAPIFWTGTRVVVVAGENKGGAGARDALLYDPVADVWQAKASGSPPALLDPTIALVGNDVLVFGGNAASFDLQTLYDFGYVSNVWTSPSNVGAPSARSGAFGAVNGATLYVWGGTTDTRGKRYSPVTGWGGSLADAGAPLARRVRSAQSGWSTRAGVGAVLFMGGIGVPAADFKKDGALYDTAADAWSAVPAWPSGSDHEWGAGVYTDADEFVVWGGRNAGLVTAAGERWHR